jgi:hypothetical protein
MSPRRLSVTMSPRVLNSSLPPMVSEMSKGDGREGEREGGSERARRRVRLRETLAART